MRIPPYPTKGGSVQATIREIIDYIRATTITSVSGGKMRVYPNGTVIEIKPKEASGGSSPSECPFGEIIDIPDTDPIEKGIRGGVVYCGDQNWNFDPQELNLSVDGTWLVYLEIDVEVNRDDDEEIILPGIKTGTKPTGDWSKITWSIGTDYPDNDPPDVNTGNGTIIIPLGKLKIEDDVATFNPAGCGNIIIGQCGGTLSHSRV
jgi:hypothetical protein